MPLAAPAGAAVSPESSPEVTITYLGTTDSGAITTYTRTFTLPNAVTGQVIYAIVFTEEAFDGTPSIGGSTTGVTVLETDTFGTDFSYLVEKTGFNGTSLDVSMPLAANATWFVAHFWRVAGLAYVASSFQTSVEAASNTTAAVITPTKADGDYLLMGTRKYQTVTGGTVSQDFGTSSCFAGRMAAAGAFSSALTANADTNFTFKYFALFELTPT